MEPRPAAQDPPEGCHIGRSGRPRNCAAMWWGARRYRPSCAGADRQIRAHAGKKGDQGQIANAWTVAAVGWPNEAGAQLGLRIRQHGGHGEEGWFTQGAARSGA